jgi:hypothetical protein
LLARFIIFGIARMQNIILAGRTLKTKVALFDRPLFDLPPVNALNNVTLRTGNDMGQEKSIC